MRWSLFEEGLMDSSEIEEKFSIVGDAKVMWQGLLSVLLAFYFKLWQFEL